MYLKSSICLLLLVSVAALPGCSSNGDWPNLSDKMPDPASRNRAVERANPSVTPRTQDTAPQTQEDARALVNSVVQDSETLGAEFEKIFRRVEEASLASDGDLTIETYRHLWFEAQLALTRFSQASSRLDSILFNTELDGSDVWKQASDRKKNIDAFVVAMRRGLASLKPGSLE